MQVKSKFLLFGKSEQRKQLQQNNLISFILVIALVLFALVFYLRNQSFKKSDIPSKFAEVITTPVPSRSPSPTPKPLTFAEMNALYGPCIKLPTLMYHHIQSKEQANLRKQNNLTVNTDVFKSQMQYLKDRGYSVVSVSALTNFFDGGSSIPGKSVLITFDDGYGDFYTDAYPILSGLGFPATVFIPTGLMNNPGYLSWEQIDQMKGLVMFGNHTWSHKSVLNSLGMQREISIADTQLSDHGANSPKVFAYPYGPDTVPAENYLQSLGYQAAFTTKPGNILCKKQRFALPRIRIGNVSLSNYGF